ncbi:hypothetical protein NLG97_g8589 [Lecanicillium saksenae]|uniref:Uncharacterized protein n=1 Tax=Lecanicillium saksenae TaxID=468837 RepID=A0ACC1QJP2_9HYPO|nr:hypothetical protein NLG97_g8589 [Lecanicillium saksenae]
MVTLEEASGSLLQKPSDTPLSVPPRDDSSYNPLSTFTLNQQRSYQQQYGDMYFLRLTKIKPAVEQPIHELVSALFPGPHALYSTRMLSGDYHRREEPLFAVDLARKDARHAKALAAAAGTRMRNVETADAHLALLKEHAGPTGDIAGIYGAVRKEAGLKFENDA